MMSESSIRCENCGILFCRSEGNMGPLCSRCECSVRAEQSALREKEPSFMGWKWHPSHGKNPDWMIDTIRHISRIQDFLSRIIVELIKRSDSHDRSKLEEPESSTFSEYTAKLRGCTYGSDEYKQFLKEMKPALDHHYSVSRHHPEHFPGGIRCMNLVDLIEMAADWLAASERHADGNIIKSIEVNSKRFEIPAELCDIILNTATWLKGETL